uniref:Col_cuticle_N domain-containing protein n=1 Tax=Angiostrongylus cantonensis TaxID=6313 RepID=A0A0K0DRL2_ANGCA
MNAQRYVLAATCGISAVGIVIALCVTASVVSEMKSFYGDVIVELEEFNGYADDAWVQMLKTTSGGDRHLSVEVTLSRVRREYQKPPTGIHAVKSDAYEEEAADRCKCAPRAQNCPPGPPGPAGEPGMPGEDGEKGENGKPGLTGLQGVANDISGGGCIKCPAGPPGPPGPIGIAGPEGSTGSPGIDGAVAKNGEPGAPGPAGPPGPDGKPGSDGPPGEAGAPGTKSTNEPGPPGPSGPPGSPGSDGEAGTSGAEAIPGPIGPPGLPGKDGAPGIAGPPGETGTAGPPGPDAAYCPCPARSMTLVGEVTHMEEHPIIVSGTEFEKGGVLLVGEKNGTLATIPKVSVEKTNASAGVVSSGGVDVKEKPEAEKAQQPTKGAGSTEKEELSTASVAAKGGMKAVRPIEGAGTTEKGETTIAGVSVAAKSRVGKGKDEKENFTFTYLASVTPTAPAGSAGPEGAASPSGVAGVTGVKGATGPAGPAGPAGLAGPEQKTVAPPPSPPTVPSPAYPTPSARLQRFLKRLH